MTCSPSPCWSTRRAELLETSLHHLRPIAEASEAGASGSHGVGVTVDAEQVHVGPRVEQRGRVACATDRAVDDQSAGTGKRSSTTSRAITGRCENSSSTSVSSPLSPEPRRRRSRLQPPGRQAPPGMSPRVGYG